MKNFLVVWLIASVVSAVLATVWMRPWVEEKEAIYTLYLPDLPTPTLAERQDLAYRWFHKESVVDLERLDFEKFKAQNLVFYDYDLEILKNGFSVAYLALAEDGKVCHAAISHSWLSPFSVVSHKLEGDQLRFWLKRDNRMVGAFFVFAVIAGFIVGMGALDFVYPRARRKQLARGSA